MHVRDLGCEGRSLAVDTHWGLLVNSMVVLTTEMIRFLRDGHECVSHSMCILIQQMFKNKEMHMAEYLATN